MIDARLNDRGLSCAQRAQLAAAAELLPVDHPQLWTDTALMHAARRRTAAADRAPFATLQAAAEVAAEIRQAPGWTVELVRGDAPSGPPMTRANRSRALSATRRARRVPPAVIARAPDGRRVTIGSRERWHALAEAAR